MVKLSTFLKLAPPSKTIKLINPYINCKLNCQFRCHYFHYYNISCFSLLMINCQGRSWIKLENNKKSWKMNMEYPGNEGNCNSC